MKSYSLHQRLTAPALALAVVAVNCASCTNNIETVPTSNVGCTGPIDVVNVTVAQVDASPRGLTMQLSVNDVTNPKRIFSYQELLAIVGSRQEDYSTGPSQWTGNITLGNQKNSYSLNAGLTNITHTVPNTIQWFTNGNWMISGGISGYGQFIYNGPTTLQVQGTGSLQQGSCIQINALQGNNVGPLWMPAPAPSTGCHNVSLTVSNVASQNSLNGLVFQMQATDLTNFQNSFTFSDMQKMLGTQNWVAYINGSTGGTSIQANIASERNIGNNTIQWFTSLVNSSTVPENVRVVYVGQTENVKLDGVGNSNICVNISAPSVPVTIYPRSDLENCTEISLNVTGSFITPTLDIVYVSVSGPAGLNLSQDALKVIANTPPHFHTGYGFYAVPNDDCIKMPTFLLQSGLGAVSFPAPNTISWIGELATGAPAPIQTTANQGACKFNIVNNAAVQYSNNATGWASPTDPYCVKITSVTGSIPALKNQCIDLSLSVSGAISGDKTATLTMSVSGIGGAPIPSLSPLALKALALIYNNPTSVHYNGIINSACTGYDPSFILNPQPDSNIVGATSNTITWTITSPSVFAHPQTNQTGPSNGCYISVSNANATTFFSNSTTGTGLWGAATDPFCVNVVQFGGAIKPLEFTCQQVELTLTGVVFPGVTGAQIYFIVMPTGGSTDTYSSSGIYTLSELTPFSFPGPGGPQTIPYAPFNFTGTPGCTGISLTSVSMNQTGPIPTPTPLTVNWSTYFSTGYIIPVQWASGGNPSGDSQECHITVSNPGLINHFPSYVNSSPNPHSLTGFWGAPNDPYCVHVSNVTGYITPVTGACTFVSLSLTGHVNDDLTGITGLHMTVHYITGPHITGPSGKLLSLSGLQALAQLYNSPSGITAGILPFRIEPTGCSGACGVYGITGGASGSITGSGIFNELIWDPEFTSPAHVFKVQILNYNPTCIAYFSLSGLTGQHEIYRDQPGFTGFWGASGLPFTLNGGGDPYCVVVSGVSGILHPYATACVEVTVNLSATSAPPNHQSEFTVAVSSTGVAKLSRQAIRTIYDYIATGGVLKTDTCSTPFTTFTVQSFTSNQPYVLPGAGDVTLPTTINWTSTITSTAGLYKPGCTPHMSGVNVWHSHLDQTTSDWATSNDPYCVIVTYTGAITRPLGPITQCHTKWASQKFDGDGPTIGTTDCNAFVFIHEICLNYADRSTGEVYHYTEIPGSNLSNPVQSNLVASQSTVVQYPAMITAYENYCQGQYSRSFQTFAFACEHKLHGGLTEASLTIGITGLWGGYCAATASTSFECQTQGHQHPSDTQVIVACP